MSDNIMAIIRIFSFQLLCVFLIMSFWAGQVIADQSQNSSEQESSRQKLVIASIDWCPQLCPKGEREGYIMDTVKEIFDDSPYKLEIVTYPWSRSIHLTRSGDVHALLSPAKPEAPDLLYPQEEVGAQRMCFFVSKSSSWKYRGKNSLPGQMIGIAHDTSIEELNSYILDNQESFHYITYGPKYLPLSFRMVDKGRLDSFLFTYNSTIYALKQEGYDQKITPAGCVSKANVYLAFTPDLKQRKFVIEAMKYFDEEMAKLVKAGRIPEIMNNYGLPNWKGATPSVF